MCKRVHVRANTHSLSTVFGFEFLLIVSIFQFGHVAHMMEGEVLPGFGRKTTDKKVNQCLLSIS